MYYFNYYTFINNYVRVGEKLMSQFNVIDSLKFKQLEIIFRIPSENSLENGFTTMLMLTEKMINQKPIFLIDKNTLSKKKVIKIGLLIYIKNEMIHFYLKMCCLHSIPKFYINGVSFHLSHKQYSFYYTIEKILSNTIFSFDKDVSSYYDYLGELPYYFDFLFRSNCKHLLINKLIVSNKGINFINTLNSNLFIQIKEMTEIIEKEESLNNSDFSDEDENEIIECSIEKNHIIDETVYIILDSDIICGEKIENIINSSEFITYNIDFLEYGR